MLVAGGNDDSIFGSCIQPEFRRTTRRRPRRRTGALPGADLLLAIADGVVGRGLAEIQPLAAHGPRAAQSRDARPAPSARPGRQLEHPSLSQPQSPGAEVTPVLPPPAEPSEDLGLQLDQLGLGDPGAALGDPATSSSTPLEDESPRISGWRG